MSPQPPDEMAPRRRSRHAAGAGRRTLGNGAFSGDTFSGDTFSDDTFSADMVAEASSGRHRRPESLADQTQLRPVSSVPSQHRRSTDGRFELSAERKPPRQRPAHQTEQSAERAHWAAERDRRRAERAQQREKVSHHRPGSGGRGKHAAPPAPVVTVRALPVVRDAVVDGLPAAKRAADAVREWALYTGDRPPVTGSHRAPGTLPIESWLLIGRGRQQALLATLIAAGLALVMIPIQRHESVNPINTANRSTVARSTATSSLLPNAPASVTCTPTSCATRSRPKRSTVG